MPTELIIFDNDGTLCDSEEINNTATANILLKLGFSQYTAEFCHEHLAGMAMSDVREKVENESGKKLPDNFTSMFVQSALLETERSMRPVPGSVEAAKLLSKSYKVCVGSNGERTNVLTSIRKIGLMDLFTEDRIYTKSQVSRGKPAPDLFLHAANAMKVAPEKTIVIEDSPSGARAGLAAGMRVLGIAAVSHNAESMTKNLKTVGVERVFVSWPEIVDYIKNDCG